MQDAQQIFEFKALHDRCDDLSSGINVLTDAVSDLLLRVRAYENIINGSWFLSRWLGQMKIIREMKRVDDMEGLLNKTQAEREQRAAQQIRIEQSKQAREKVISQRLDKREKQLKRELRKSEKNGGKK